MQAISLRAQIWIIALGYAGVFAFAGVTIYARYLWEARNPEIVMASSGMYAAGDTILAIIIVCLLMIPTVFLIWVMARFEGAYTTYAQLLLGLSVTAPVGLNVLAWGSTLVTDGVLFLALFRVFWSPFVLVGMGVSRWAARFDRAKKLVSYALIIEGLTLAIGVVLLIQAWGRTNNI